MEDEDPPKVLRDEDENEEGSRKRLDLKISVPLKIHQDDDSTTTTTTTAAAGNNVGGKFLAPPPREFAGLASPGATRVVSLRRTPIHEAVLIGTVQDLERRLESLDDMARLKALSGCDENGFTPLMSAVSLSDEKDAGEKTRLLVKYGASVRVRDKEGFLAVHWATVSDNVEAMRVLLETDGSLATVRAENRVGDTPLHRACRLAAGTRVPELLVCEWKVSPCTLNNLFETCVDVLGRFPNEGQAKSLAKARSLLRPILFRAVPETRTLLLHHEDCLNHETAKLHQESPERVRVILNEIESSPIGKDGSIWIMNEFAPSNKEDVLRAHDVEYVELLEELNRDMLALESPEPVAFTPRVQRAISRTSKIKPDTACDTFFSRGSLPAALRAAGAVQFAIDTVIKGNARNAFCVVRPPGHHAGVRGLLDNAASCGFCLINSVMVGALGALAKYPDRVRRVAIVDFDVHAGNGTEDIVVKRVEDPSTVMLFSMHLYDKEQSLDGTLSAAESSSSSSTSAFSEGGAAAAAEKLRRSISYEFYPGSGLEDILKHNVYNAPITPLWKDANSSRTTTRARAGSSAGGGEASSSPPPPVSGRLAVRQIVSTRLVPLLRAYGPDLILISAGFDAAQGDIGCLKGLEESPDARGRVVCVGGCDLTCNDFAWITKQVTLVANMCCEGRVVSVLEGGYGKWVTPKKSSSFASTSSSTPGMKDSPPLNNHNHNNSLSTKALPEINREYFAKCCFAHLNALAGCADDGVGTRS